MSAVVNVPAMSHALLPLRLLLGGWTLSNIMDVRSGLPFGIASGRDNSFSGIGQDRADLLRDPALPVDRPKSDRLARYFDSQAVDIQRARQLMATPRAISCAACRPSILMPLCRRRFR